MMITKTEVNTNGTHPPCGNFMIEAKMKSASIAPKLIRKHTAKIILRPHTIDITKTMRNVVTSIPVITAKPATKSTCWLLDKIIRNEKAKTLYVSDRCQSVIMQ